MINKSLSTGLLYVHTMSVVVCIEKSVLGAFLITMTLEKGSLWHTRTPVAPIRPVGRIGGWHYVVALYGVCDMLCHVLSALMLHVWARVFSLRSTI
ncbi:hypothetical protein F5Y16DRAFT_380691 [Xylariaceae sp. FL0255]|nr:hypothetical protein F5Y16DRAFT_380691 [Xylariaceae sp. FL0255]